jgi:hypothetical protein
MHIIVRVELHAATTVTQYEALHRAMAGAGFQRTIPGGQDSEWELPTASYYSNRFPTVEEAKTAAWQAARGAAPIAGAARPQVGGHFWYTGTPAASSIRSLHRTVHL